MGVAGDQIVVRSHVARDLLQNAALFKTDKLVVWEYVANGLQYIDSGTNPVVKVVLDSKKKKIVIKDNGRGMDWAGLGNFFVMHGENIDRKEGRPGRGRFGTGKSAALGIADVLRIKTVRNGKRSQVEIRRNDIQSMGLEDSIPVRTLEREVPTTESNGTTVEIEGVHLKSLDQAGIIQYIERHLARWPKNATVFVNNHECEFAEPPVAHEKRFTPEGDLPTKLGDVVLVVKVSKAPLPEDLRGISIYASGNWYETTLAGSEGRDMAQYLFGEIDVPALETDSSPIPPFDVSRSMRLNPSNELVQAIYAFVGRKVEEVRRELVEEEKRHKADEERKRLAEQAAEIAKVINEDFDAWRHRVAKARAKAFGGQDAIPAGLGSGDDDLVPGSTTPAKVVSPTGAPGSTQPGNGGGTEPRNLRPKVAPDPEGSALGKPSGPDRQSRPRGGFQVRFDHLGDESNRALYVTDDRTIYINLDHPQLVTARADGSLEDPVFLQLAYEVAFSEYAVALTSELERRGEYIDPSDPIVAIRETLNRVARRGATLFGRR